MLICLWVAGFRCVFLVSRCFVWRWFWVSASGLVFTVRFCDFVWLLVRLVWLLV